MFSRAIIGQLTERKSGRARYFLAVDTSFTEAHLHKLGSVLNKLLADREPSKKRKREIRY
ncbi:MAG: hypothetical protein C0518_07995 [Opitutus sp.]|nr:hypothetical protein [Opitutus sp.]